MFQGKTHAALDLLANRGKGGVLQLDQLSDPSIPDSSIVRDVLISKHPPGEPASPTATLNGPVLDQHPIIYDGIDARLIRSTSLKVSGAAGPSGLDAHAWRRLCTAFKAASDDLCMALAEFAKRLCTSLLDPQGLAPFLACRLIALDKCPGVRPIGIGDTARRIIAKAVLTVTREDIQDAAGSLQLCANQISGCEAAVHSIREGFQHDDTEAALLVDASNAFNSINRMSALKNIQLLCPSIANIVINCYRSSTELFIEGDTLYSREGTTQGDPLGMPMYALATVPLINSLRAPVDQAWYADDAAATGSIANLRAWWDEIVDQGPGYGYHANGSKTWLIVKDGFKEEAEAAFSNTAVKITCDGRPHLGAPLGSPEYTTRFVEEKVQAWSQELSLLSAIATTQPHAAFAAYTHGLISKWQYLARTVCDIDHHLEKLDLIVKQQLVPTLTSRPPPTSAEMELLGLPARLGGLGLSLPSWNSNDSFNGSLQVTAPLRMSMKSSEKAYSYEVMANQLKAKTDVRSRRREAATLTAEGLRNDLSEQLQRAMDLAREKGASSWLTALPLTEHGFTLHKRAFVDAVCLRYGWTPSRIPTTCVCGSSFTVEHALSCPRGGFPSIRHNEIRDITATLLTEVCNDVCVEPDLQEVTSECLRGKTANSTSGARLDIAANGFWGGRYERTFVDVRVFNPHAASNRCTTISKCYVKHEREKKRAYEQRVREIEHASFTPLVLSATGGFSREATNFYKTLASKLATKWDQPYSLTMNWLRCTLSYALLRSSIQCLRGARSHKGHAFRGLPVDLATTEAHITPC